MGRMSTTKSCHCCGGSGTELDHRVVGTEMRRLRLSKQLTQTDVAKRMRISKPYVSDLESGRRNWRDELVARYTKALNK